MKKFRIEAALTITVFADVAAEDAVDALRHARKLPMVGLVEDDKHNRDKWHISGDVDGAPFALQVEEQSS